jgi:predicted negative regulator of RcsB-dependent stress response
MSTQSLFTKKDIKPIEPERKRDLLDELNLPPKLISFIRENARNLQIAVITVTVIVLGWVLYNNYTELQENKSASMLASALQESAVEQKAQTLAAVIDEYPRTDAAQWSMVELAHLDYQAGRFQEAASRYETILAKLSGDSPLAPLVRLNLAQSYEELNDHEKALGQYRTLKTVTGFSREASLAMGRIYEYRDEPQKASQVYEEYLNSLGEEPDPVIKAEIQGKLTALQVEKTAAAPLPQPVEQEKKE